jgi:hypothetical protein
MNGEASFDKVRMKFFLRGTWQMPVSVFLLLCLSKDAKSVMQRLGKRSPARHSAAPRTTAPDMGASERVT